MTAAKAYIVSRVLRALSGFVAVVFWMSPTAANDGDYHLTGIIGSNSAKAFAVIELADGQQHLLAEGSTIDTGYVGSISAREKTVVLVFPEGKRFLSLTGSAMPDDSTEDSTEEYSIADYTGDVSSKVLDQTSLKKLRALASASEKMSDNERTTQLNRLLGLPSQARITAFNGSGVDSTRDLLKVLAAQLATRQDDMGGHLGTIAVSDEAGRRRVYLQVTPNSSE